VRIFNVSLVDGGQQFLKASPSDGTVDDVEVACSRFIMTDDGRGNVWGYGEEDVSTTRYTGGIDTHDACTWVVRNNHFEGIYCDTDPGRPAHGMKPAERDSQTYAGVLAEHAIHMWNSPEGSGHVIEANTIIDCARGIGRRREQPDQSRDRRTRWGIRGAVGQRRGRRCGAVRRRKQRRPAPDRLRCRPDHRRERARRHGSGR
jgi:hypothetical protein